MNIGKTIFIPSEFIKLIINEYGELESIEVRTISKIVRILKNIDTR